MVSFILLNGKSKITHAFKSADAWIMGTPYLQAVYTVFNPANLTMAFGVVK